MKKLNPILTSFGLLAILFLLLPKTFMLSGCANIIPPSGGPRDSLPPLLMTQTPRDSTLNFDQKKITIIFDEYITVENIQENLIVNPTPKINPIILSKLRTLTINLKDTLEENTTYSLEFGKAIKDINEGNILRNFTYIFSTGNSIDSLTVAGKVILAETGGIDSTLIAVLHTSAVDSAVVKENPRYVTRVDGEGQFLFRNLPPGKFSLYTMKDEGGSRRYLAPTEQLFGFLNEQVEPAVEPELITLLAYTMPDTSSASNSGAPPRPSAAGRRGDSKEPDNRLRMQTNIVSNRLDLLSPLIVFTAQDSLVNQDTTKIQLTDAAFKPFTNYKMTLDSTGKRYTFDFAFTPDTEYNLIIDTAFASDTLGRRILKIDTLNFRTKKESEYGMVRLRFLNLDLEKNPVLQIIKGGKVEQSHPFVNNQFYARIFQPGEYDMRILFDDNKNGIWDPGDFFGTRKQPETVIPIARKLNVKANWDNEIDITLE